MPQETSAGLMMYRVNKETFCVLLVHPGGPFFKNKDDGYWSIPKGLPEKEEELLDTAVREFEEETGIKPSGDYLPLGSVKQKNGKTVYAWAVENKDDASVKISSNTFEMEWPPKSAKVQKFPEVDRGEYFGEEEARQKINEAQTEFITRLKKHLYRK